MTFLWLILGLLAPVQVYAAAFPQAIPGPTPHFIAEMDPWGPAPTAAPILNLFKRQGSEGSNTCGFVSGFADSPITCDTPSQICATNTFSGVHGCCNPSNDMSDCTIPTSCIASASAATIPASISPDAAVTRCTDPAAPACYELFFVYARTIMTQHGCAASAYTRTVMTSPNPTFPISGKIETETVTVTAAPISTFSTASPLSGGSVEVKAKTRLAPIIGGTIGACIFLSLIVFAVFLACRRRSAKNKSQLPHSDGTRDRQAMLQFNATGFLDQQASYANEIKASAVCSQGGGDVEEYPGMGRQRVGIVEVDGVQRAVEAPTGER